MSLRTGLAYGFVAATCLALHNGVMIATDWAMRGAGPLAISSVGFALSFIVVSLVGYVLHSHLTFREPMSFGRYGRYALAMSTNTPLALGVTWVLRGPVGLAMVYAAPLASCLMVGMNFLLSRWAIVRK
ncbi:GtrA family protein [Novosphingobium sp. SG707]|uniref:GtrA family protein n=1 Tax=Novosphingobium sp. SG707 TaxID=2586996 RepID=UPI0014478F5E|nr:GtrA family protein [Novosphingobium sp. SG707]NKI99994.1 putative flippase GtrA [Novosphingobium sp. SG707]